CPGAAKDRFNTVLLDALSTDMVEAAPDTTGRFRLKDSSPLSRRLGAEFYLSLERVDPMRTASNKRPGGCLFPSLLFLGERSSCTPGPTENTCPVQIPGTLRQESIPEPDPTHSLEERVVRWYFSVLDKNSNGEVNKREIKVLRQYVRNKTRPKKCSRNFIDYCDANQDQILTLDEFLRCTIEKDNTNSTSNPASAIPGRRRGPNPFSEYGQWTFSQAVPRYGHCSLGFLYLTKEVVDTGFLAPRAASPDNPVILTSAMSTPVRPPLPAIPPHAR
ncbi:SPARC- modular calcium-binding protein 1, partial [Branchiostoma belcheri]